MGGAPSSGKDNASASAIAPSRKSRRQLNAEPDFEIDKLDKKSKIGKELASNLVLNAEALKKRREKKFAFGDKWAYERLDPEHVNDASAVEEDDNNIDSGGARPQNQLQDTTDGRKRGRKRKASRRDQGLAGPSRGAKAPRTKKTTENEQQNDIPPGDELADNGAGNETTPPGDDDGGEDNLASNGQAPAPEQPPPRNADEKFLRDCTQQLRSQKPIRWSMREIHVRNALAVLKVARQPSEDRIQFFANIPAEEHSDKPDLYLLDASEAKRLLESDLEVQAPVFVPNGAREGLFTGGVARPIEQFLRTWLLDENEQVNVANSARELCVETVARLRKHFLEAERESFHPWNVPDIPNPRPESCLPHFVQSINCNLLRDVVRRALDATVDEICPEICPNAHGDRLGCSNDGHKLTRKEYHRLMECWEHWQGTAMLADPGAITTSHWDSWGMGTWISCHEGQIGIVWRSHPSEQEVNYYLWDRAKAHTMGISIYKVLRPGDAVYMPPGTIHTVFRRPCGNQTLGFAGHVVRRSCLAEWIRVFDRETANVENNWHVMKGSDHEHIVPPMARAIRAILGERGSETRSDSFGRRPNLQTGENQLRALEGRGERLQRLAFISPAVSREPSPEQQDDLEEEDQVMSERGKKPKKKNFESTKTKAAPRTKQRRGKEKAKKW